MSARALRSEASVALRNSGQVQDGWRMSHSRDRLEGNLQVAMQVDRTKKRMEGRLKRRDEREATVTCAAPSLCHSKIAEGGTRLARRRLTRHEARSNEATPPIAFPIPSGPVPSDPSPVAHSPVAHPQRRPTHGQISDPISGSALALPLPEINLKRHRTPQRQSDNPGGRPRRWMGEGWDTSGRPPNLVGDQWETSGRRVGDGREVSMERMTSPASKAKPTNNGALDSANRLVPFSHSLPRPPKSSPIIPSDPPRQARHFISPGSWPVDLNPQHPSS
ncbi:hypothetical protein F5Y14DRAFT_459349 [Nemania sp. NC0429]|nr:hypothetical protein F5Y14DRAFT_459349 [Nemania sp. NC0429]